MKMLNIGTRVQTVSIVLFTSRNRTSSQRRVLLCTKIDKKLHIFTLVEVEARSVQLIKRFRPAYYKCSTLLH